MAKKNGNTDSAKTTKSLPNSHSGAFRISEIKPNDWGAMDEGAKKEYLDCVEGFYKEEIIDGWFEISEEAAEKYLSNSKNHVYWRVAITILSGLLAILNLLIAYSYTELLALPAALFAASLAVMTNLESLLKNSDKAKDSREIREKFLDAYREYTMLWQVHVFAHGQHHSACINASALYGMSVDKDKELRNFVREQLSTSKNKTSAN